MQQKLNVASQAQSFQKHGRTLTTSARSVTIHLFHTKTGKARTEKFLQDHWEDYDFSRGFEIAWTKERFQMTQTVYP
jgi:hypothetical protein